MLETMTDNSDQLISTLFLAKKVMRSNTLSLHKLDKLNDTSGIFILDHLIKIRRK